MAVDGQGKFLFVGRPHEHRHVCDRSGSGALTEVPPFSISYIPIPGSEQASVQSALNRY